MLTSVKSLANFQAFERRKLLQECEACVVDLITSERDRTDGFGRLVSSRRTLAPISLSAAKARCSPGVRSCAETSGAIERHVSSMTTLARRAESLAIGFHLKQCLIVYDH